MTIITLSEPGLQAQSWQWHLQNAVRSIEDLGRALDLDLSDVQTQFPLLVPLPYLHRMEPGNLLDPLLLQVLPREIENSATPGFVRDPLSEVNESKLAESEMASSETLPAKTKGIIQKYQGRVLLITTGACAINCRYCFRRHFPYQDFQPAQSDWDDIVERLLADTSITEVIFSGGDPLVMPDSYLKKLVLRLSLIKHIDTFRFHTRLPVVIPQRITEELTTWISDLPQKVVFVLHTNHANEIDDEVTSSLRKLKQSGVTLLNQSVLLSGVNDSAAALVNLSRKLFETDVLPYYLHLLDPVAGAAHFDVPESVGQQLIKEISGQLPGYLVPKLVREVPGENAKQMRI